VFCVKAYSTDRAATDASRWIGEGTLVVTLQNGLDNAERLAERFGADRVLVGTTSEGATLIAEGDARHAGHGTTVVGAMSPSRNDDAHRFVELLRDAGFDASHASDWRSAVWTKAVLNAAINPVTAILGVTNGTLAELDPLRRLVMTLAQEGGSVARRGGVSVPDDLADRAVALCRKTASNRSSMLQDIERGGDTELENINGVLLREAARHHLEAQALRAITELARARALLARR
jgi:2-dehydropantoate 2-reductase